ncbi:NADH-quinone oxidoreductase subunit NuoE [bacterium]|nr:NADH-quinone oxidoreductase subunit NuoE [bacterium]
MGFEFSEQGKQEIERLLKVYPISESVIIPALHLAQKENGWVSDSVCSKVAEMLNVPPSKVKGVATFYTMFSKKPKGKYWIQVCRNLTCSIMGAEHIIKYLEQLLRIKTGETTRDQMFTLDVVECLGSCGTAPVIMINDKYYENLNEPRIEQLIDELRDEG